MNIFDQLPDDIHSYLLKYLDFDSIKNLNILFPDYKSFSERYNELAKASIICEKYLSKRLDVKNDKRVIKSNFDSLNQNKYFFLHKKIHIKVKDASGHIYNTTIISLNTNNDTCDKSCFNCGRFYPSLLCMIVCKHHCTCDRCKSFLEQFLLDDTFFYEINAYFE
jgi:hypothetical protein